MLVYTHDVHQNPLLKIDEYYNPHDVLIFDIETTGFSADTTKLYLIGCGFYTNGKWVVRQWLNNDGTSEKELLLSFIDFVKQYKYILHYNGDGFDIPYIEKKLKKYQMTFAFNAMESIDLYKLIRPYKDILHLDNLKQKTLEGLININRLDKYSGGDLIKIYNSYIESDDKNYEKLLIQHNYEDIEGLMYCFSLMSYKLLEAGNFSVKKMSVQGDYLCFSLELKAPIPVRISLGNENIIVTAYNSEATIKAKIIEDELKFFFENYSDYYYLPTEDIAVHKSVAAYVDRNYRTQAKRSNCYTKRHGYFISQIDSGIIKGYKINYDDKESYIELADSFLQDMELINKYTKHIISKML